MKWCEVVTEMVCILPESISEPWLSLQFYRVSAARGHQIMGTLDPLHHFFRSLEDGPPFFLLT